METNGADVFACIPKRQVRKWPWLTLAAALLLGGCAAMDMQRESEANETANNAAFPENYKADIVALMRTYLNDPSNVRDAFVSVPVIRPITSIKRYVSCVRYNAKKDGGQYAGPKDSIVIFRLGKLERIIDNGRELCKDAPYQPFPELQRMSR